jgi:transposase-like protein
MDQRVAFIADWLRNEWTMTELAARYQISRKTAYKWVERYEADPAHGLAERTLQEETTTPPAPTPRAQQRRFDRMRTEFNVVRPHEALGQQPPARCYQPSPRPYPARLEDPWYDATHQVRRVKETGQIRWQGELVFVSEAVR